MTNFSAYGKLWDIVVELHWDYLNAEEQSVERPEIYKRLEEHLREFLSSVKHDKKFFLCETKEVLEKSFSELNDFSIEKACSGFLSISEYANNLFMKPWRKEYRVLKLYSGFYQHEIKSNLLFAEKLFIAMGYRPISPSIFALDGPICPDQVMNVSRDAMLARLELKIIAEMHRDLNEANIPFSLKDVKSCREVFIGSPTNMLNEIKVNYYAKEKQKQQYYSEGYCSSTLPYGQQQLVPQCHQYNSSQLTHPINGQYAMQKQMQPNCYCQSHPQTIPTAAFQQNGGNNKFIPTYPTAAAPPPFQHNPMYLTEAHPLHMTHSRSLEHHNENQKQLIQRHSFDRPHQHQHHYHNYPQMPMPAHVGSAQHHYETPYDSSYDALSMGGGSTVSYTDIQPQQQHQTQINNYNGVSANEYNVSGTRYALPRNVSKQFIQNYDVPQQATNNMPMEDTYASITKTNPSYHPTNYLYHQEQQQQPIIPMRQISSSNAHAAARQQQQQQQCSFSTDQLIDFDDHAHLTKHDFNSGVHSFTQSDAYDPYHNTNHKSSTTMNRVSKNDGSLAPKDMRSSATEDMYALTYALPRKEKLVPNVAHKENSSIYLGSTDPTQEYVDNQVKMKRDYRERTTKSGDYGDNSNNESTDYEQLSEVIPTQATINEDGIGSYGKWNNVYQNLQNNGVNGKNPNSDNDTLIHEMKSMKLGDVDANNYNSIEKHHSRNTEKERRDASLARLLTDSTPTATRTTNENYDKKKQEKSILKHSNSNSNTNSNKNTKQQGRKVNGYNNNSRGKRTNISDQTPKRQTSFQRENSVDSEKKWRCAHCTYLNSEKIRICDMCCHSKDFNFEATISKTPTCV